MAPRWRTLVSQLSRSRFVWLSLLLACGQSTAGPGEELPADTDFPVAIQTLTQHVAPGAAVQLEVENNSAIWIGFNLCTDGALERWTTSGWKTLTQLPYPCPLMLFRIESGQSTVLPFSVPSDAPQGTYRVRVRFVAMVGSQSIVRRSNTFGVS
jgi:hypothetical protein